jgi:hypothetical protein
MIFKINFEYIFKHKNMRSFLIYLFLFFPFFSFSQSNFLKGYLITNSNDTLKGYIDYRERSYNPTSVSFKAAEDAKPKNFTLINCAGYGIEGTVSYQRFIVNVTTSAIAVSQLHLGPDLTVRRDTVFLKLIQAGKNVNLYSYQDDIKLRFYIKDNNSMEPVELIRQMYMKEDGTRVVTTDGYKRQLLGFAKASSSGTEADLRMIRDYNESDINKFVAIVNHQEVVKSKIPNTRYFIGTGLNISKSNYKGSGGLANDIGENKGSSLPYITLGADLFANPAIGKLIYRIELSFLVSKNERSTTTTIAAMAALTHKFNKYSAVLTPQIIYNVYSSDPVKVFIGGGLAFNASSYSNNVSTRTNSATNELIVTEDEVVFESFTFAVPLNAGVVINKKIELSGGYTFPSTISKTGTSFAAGMEEQRIKVGISYLFGGK